MKHDCYWRQTWRVEKPVRQAAVVAQASVVFLVLVLLGAEPALWAALVAVTPAVCRAVVLRDVELPVPPPEPIQRSRQS